jgi:hypothetical protein
VNQPEKVRHLNVKWFKEVLGDVHSQYQSLKLLVKKLIRLAGQTVLLMRVLLEELFQKWEADEMLREIAKIRQFLEGWILPFMEAGEEIWLQRPSIP